MSAAIKVEIQQLPHGKGLALPAYQSAHAAGLDLLAAVPEDAPMILAPASTRWFRPGSSSHCRRASRRRSARAPALPPSMASPC